MASREHAFVEKLKHACEYPGSLIATGNNERDRDINAYRRCFEEQVKHLFDDETHADTHLIIRDYGGEAPDKSLPRAPLIDNIGNVDNIDFRCLELQNINDLKTRLSWPSDIPDQVALKKDPKCRFILFEAASSESRLLLLTREMIYLILTYHQVSPCYLNFIASLGSSTSATDLAFGGFRAHLFLRSNGPEILPLRRSGSHYQLSFRLHTVQEHQLGLGRKWLKQNAAVYHCFDVKNGTSLWILTGPRDVEAVKASHENVNHAKNYMWESVKQSIRTGRHAHKFVSNDCQTCFAGSTAVLASLADWTLGDYSFYLHDLDSRLTPLVQDYIYPIRRHLLDIDTQVVSEDRRQMTIVLAHLQDCIVKLKANVEVLKSIQNFYIKELMDEMGHEEVNIPWLSDAKRHAEAAFDSIDCVLAKTAKALNRAETLQNIAQNAITLVDNILQVVQNARMKEISAITSEDSAAMKNLSLITFFLLPFSVISTVLSTDIVKFATSSQGGDASKGGDGSASTGAFDFSTAAFGTWIIASIVLALGCLSASRLLRRHTGAKSKWQPDNGDGAGTESDDKGLLSSVLSTFFNCLPRQGPGGDASSPPPASESPQPRTPTTFATSSSPFTPTSLKIPRSGRPDMNSVPPTPVTPITMSHSRNSGSGDATGLGIVNSTLEWFARLGQGRERKPPAANGTSSNV